MTRMWMVRGEGGQRYDDFRDRNVVAIGFGQLSAMVKPGMSRKQLITACARAMPAVKRGALIAQASQVWRFVNEIAVGDNVVTYSPSNRTYLLGTVDGEACYHDAWVAEGQPLARSVKWAEEEIQRDSLSGPSKNSLGSTLTVFLVPDAVAADILAVHGGTACGDEMTDLDDVSAEEIIDPLENVAELALERTKDLVSKLDWEDMQELVAGILRAMGYRTQVSPAGPDRGKDIIASPDGFGFENPRIVVEVKHRSGQMGSQDIRSFLGGRHKDDRGLYVSTGGFSKDAYYEADRANVPLTLWTLDNLVRALVDHYDNTDAETKRLVPLKRRYLPV